MILESPRGPSSSNPLRYRGWYGALVRYRFSGFWILEGNICCLFCGECKNARQHTAARRIVPSECPCQVQHDRSTRFVNKSTAKACFTTCSSKTRFTPRVSVSGCVCNRCGVRLSPGQRRYKTRSYSSSRSWSMFGECLYCYWYWCCSSSAVIGVLGPQFFGPTALAFLSRARSGGRSGHDTGLSNLESAEREDCREVHGAQFFLGPTIIFLR